MAVKVKGGKDKKSSSSSSGGGGNGGLKRVKGENFYRDAKKAKTVKMLSRDGIASKAIRDAKGNIIQSAEFQSSEVVPGRVQPDRRWFGNTRVISQDALDHFRTALHSRVDDPYSVLLRRNKLPMSLLQEGTATKSSGKTSNLTSVESFSKTFGPNAQRKKPRLENSSSSFADLAASSEEAGLVADAKEQAAWEKANGIGLVPADAEVNLGMDGEANVNGSDDLYSMPVTRGRSEPGYSKGQSRRIWAELYKVIDSSTRCRSVEKHLKEEKPHKHLIFLLNKVDLVPTWVTARWVKILSKEYPTIAFHASINNSFWKSVLHSDKKQISVGFVGYPNTGKSSIINTLKKKKVCKVAPIAGETKVWQYISLMRRIYLIDCPGIVPIGMGDTETATILKGVVRVENVEAPSEHIPALMARVKPEYLRQTYNLKNWKNHEDFLSQLAHRMGKLLKGGDADLDTCAKMVINDWVRGKIPFYVEPPMLTRTDEFGLVNGKGKAKLVEQEDQKQETEDPSLQLPTKRTVKGVSQPLREIAVATKFSHADMHAGEPEDFEVNQGDEDAEEGYDEASIEAEEESEEDEEEEGESEAEAEALPELAWADVLVELVKMPKRKAMTEKRLTMQTKKVKSWRLLMKTMNWLRELRMAKKHVKRPLNAKQKTFTIV
ncbi:hypothetical protein IEQ34_026069 [Dendrobium chrysotoxum]|uniref:Nuclear/nucleolar GTPase 2 n=1 Tax=Dendrobium chrysotoxum TaxID=161865 RepID=A0AAV7FNL9_DENCH|nr:hypothetical protein IEQ34_026069 [Dendrobium chrysotoxum]